MSEEGAVVLPCERCQELMLHIEQLQHDLVNARAVTETARHIAEKLREKLRRLEQEKGPQR